MRREERGGSLSPSDGVLTIVVMGMAHDEPVGLVVEAPDTDATVCRHRQVSLIEKHQDILHVLVSALAGKASFLQ